MVDLFASLRELELSADANWSAQCFSQIASLAQDHFLLDPAKLSSLNLNKQDFAQLPTCGVKLLVELRRALLAGKKTGTGKLYRLVGLLCFWAFELQLGSKLAESKPRHAHPSSAPASDSVFESHLYLVLDACAESTNADVTFTGLDSFFARALAQLGQRTQHYQQRLREAVEAGLERFLGKLVRTDADFDPFARAVAVKASRFAMPALVRASMSRLYQAHAVLDPTLLRLLSFLIGLLDFTTPSAAAGWEESQVAMELIRGDFNLVRTVCDHLLQVAGTIKEEEEESCLLLLLGRIFTAIAGRWHLLLERTSTSAALNMTSSMEILLGKLSKFKRSADASIVRSLTQAVAILLSNGMGIVGAGSKGSSSLQTFKQQEEEERALRASALRVTTLLCFHTTSPQAELFSLALHGKHACSKELVSICVLALGFEPRENGEGEGDGMLQFNYDLELFSKFKRMLGECETLVLWSAGETALEIYASAYSFDLWSFNFALAARRVREMQRNSTETTAALQRLNLLFQAFAGLGEVKSSIRHLQDLAWFYISFGKRPGFSIASERFLVDVAKTLFDLHRYWECGNVYIMLGTCELANKRFSASSQAFLRATEAFDALDLHHESNKVRLACQVFAKQSAFPREWDWCYLPRQVVAHQVPSYAHYFLVGAVGLGDADLTVVRIVLRSAQLQEEAFDDAIEYLEQGSFRRRIAGQLRWDGKALPRFFPSESVGMDEFGFWIQRVWPVRGEEGEAAVEHCARKWGILGQPSLLISVKDEARALNALISACSVVVAEVSPAPALDIPEGGQGEEEVDYARIPLPPNAPPPPALNRSVTVSDEVSYFPSNESVSFHDSFRLPQEDEDSSIILPPDSPPPSSDVDIMPPPTSPPSSLMVDSPITPPDDTAEQRKRDFKRKRQEDAERDALQRLKEQQQQAEEERRRQEQQQKAEEERRRLQQQQKAEEERRRLQQKVEEERRRREAEEALLVQQQEEILRQQAAEAKRLRKLQAAAEKEAQEQLALKRDMEAQYHQQQQQLNESELAHQRELEEEHQRLQEQKRKLKLQQQQQQLNSTMERKSILLQDDAAESSSIEQTSTTPSPPQRGDMLIFKRNKHKQTGEEKSFSTSPASMLSGVATGEAAAATTSGGGGGSFKRKVVLLPATPGTGNVSMEDVLRAGGAKASSPPKHLFNVNGARLTLEECELLERYKEKREGWLSVTLLARGAASLRFSPAGTVEVFLEPQMELLQTLHQVRLVERGGSNVIELRQGNEKAEANEPLLLICGQVEMLRALLATSF